LVPRCLSRVRSGWLVRNVKILEAVATFWLVARRRRFCLSVPTMLVHKQSAPQLSTGYHASGSSTTLDTHKTSLSSSSFMPEPCARMLRQATAKKIAKRPPLRLQPTQGSSGPRSAPPSSFNSPAQTVAPPMPMMTTHSSLFRSALMELRIDSPAAKVLRAHGSERPRSIPIFGDNDVVQGAVSLDTQLGSGRLVVTVRTYATHFRSLALTSFTARRCLRLQRTYNCWCICPISSARFLLRVNVPYFAAARRRHAAQCFLPSRRFLRHAQAALAHFIAVAGVTQLFERA
jgi:hypothetical protein